MAEPGSEACVIAPSTAAAGQPSGTSAVRRRLGVFGGTFDPPHVGHLLVAGDALERLGLERVVFVPAATQPLKAGRTRTPAELRLAMTRALVGDDPRFVVDPVEIERGGLSFTADTLGALRARWPDAELVLLAGADVLTSFHRWRDPERVRALATLVVLARAPDERAVERPATRAATTPAGQVERREDARAADPATLPVAADGPSATMHDPHGSPDGRSTSDQGGGPGTAPEAPPSAFPGGAPLLLETRRVDLSSTEVRARVAAGRSIRGFVPESVAAIIEAAGLYR